MLTIISSDASVQNSSIIGIYNYSIFNKNPNIEFLNTANKSGRMIDVTDNKKIKSVVVTDNAVYLSSVSAGTLKKRALNKKIREELEENEKG